MKVIRRKKSRRIKSRAEQVQQRLEVSQSQSGQDIQSATPNQKSSAIPIDWQSYPYNSSGGASNS